MPWFWIIVAFIVGVLIARRFERKRYIRNGINKLEQFINARDENDDD